jgi:hypothetical protein
MKILRLLLIFVMVLYGSAFAAPPSPFIPCSDGDGLCVDTSADGSPDFRISSTGAISMGSPSSVGVEVTIKSHSAVNSEGTIIVDYLLTVELETETAGSEVSVFREYLLGSDHALKMISSTKAYSAEPTGSEAPGYGCVVTADRANWDPLSKSSGGAYLVRWDGDSWVAIDAQDD